MKKIILVFIILAVVSFSCDDRLVELNTPSKSPTEVPGETLFTNGLKEVVDQLQSVNVNVGVFKLYSQYWAQTTYPDESQYNMVSRNNPDNVFGNMYRDALTDLKNAKLAIEAMDEAALAAPVKKNQLAIADVVNVYAWSVLVDIFGHVPYSEALDGDNLNPKYDDMAEIYTSIIATLDAAIAALDDSALGISAGQDLMYAGDVAKWKLAANSLKLRLAMRLADADAAKSIQMVSQALSSGIITSNDDNFQLNYLSVSPNTNPQYDDLVLSGRADFVGANTIVDKMNSLNDPRRPVYFRENLGDGVFDGGIYGIANSYNNFSQVGDLFHTPDLPGCIISASEMQFLLAEAAARGGYTGLTKTAAEYYNTAIKLSMEEWGISTAEADAYIAQPSVAYATAAGDWKQKIGSQLWLALYNNGVEGWMTWRKFDFTGFNVPEGLEYSDIPLRMIYPINEGQRNKENKDDAASRLSNGDTPQSKVFWDKF